MYMQHPKVIIVNSANSTIIKDSAAKILENIRKRNKQNIGKDRREV